MHLLSYANNGIGLYSFHISSIIFEFISLFIMTSLITLISWGWTITYDNLNANIFSFPLLIAGLFIHIILGILTFVNNDKYSKYHDY